MLKERKISEIRYDAASDTLYVTAGVEDAGGAGPPQATGRRCQVLLDASGGIVGIDPGGSAFARTVLLRGAFEDVATTVEVDARVSLSAGEIANIAIAGASTKLPKRALAG
jgi:hypothetical protein